MMNHSLSRRTLLRGAGVAISLPWLECMATSAWGAAGQKTNRPPVRLGFVYLGMGVNMDEWFPVNDGPNYTLSRALQPLATFRQDFSVITGTRHLTTNFGGHGSSRCWLTGAPYKPGPAAEARNTISVDQLAAEHLGRETRLPSLELGHVDYFTQLSWTRQGVPLPPTASPAQVFARMFTADGHKSDAARIKAQLRQNKSILDFSLESARSLERNLGPADRRKFDEYLTSLREIETRIGRAEYWADQPAPRATIPAPSAQIDKRTARSTWLKAMYDLMALAFQTDLTRVITLAIDGNSSSSLISEAGAWEGWHELTHHLGDEEKLEQLAMIDEYHNKHFAYFLEKLNTIREADGSRLLDNCLVLQGDSMTDGNLHWGGNLPLLLAGHGGGLKQGQHLRLCTTPKTDDLRPPEASVPTSNLFVTLLQKAGVPVQSFADSTGPLTTLT